MVCEGQAGGRPGVGRKIKGRRVVSEGSLLLSCGAWGALEATGQGGALSRPCACGDHGNKKDRPLGRSAD